MRSLFVRLFVWFWGMSLLSGAIFFAIAFNFKPPHQHDAPFPPRNMADQQPGVAPSHPSPPPPAPDFPHPGGPPGPPKWEFLMGLGVQLGISAVVGGAICYLLAWRMTAPLRRLRQTVQQFADGDLAARTGAAGQCNGDEIADLSRDFDRMAERIESLLVSQRLLVRDISHELRSPLARLQVALGIARRKTSHEAEPALDRIEQEGERLNSLIGELLTLSVLENASSPGSLELFSLSQLLEEITSDARFEAEQIARLVEVFIEPQLMMRGRRKLIHRAIENLIRNGLRYTPAGTAVTLVAHGDQAGWITVKVMDHGPGVPEAMLEQIFQPFFRVADDRDRQSGGAGIGLAITARAVALHGGSVTAKNRPEGGLEVELLLPTDFGG